MTKVLFLIYLFTIDFSFAQVDWYNFERIMLIKSKSKFVLNDGLLTYSKDGRWYLPLEDLFDSIAIEFKFAKNQRLIEGYIFNEKNSYRIDLDKCEIYINEESHKVSCQSFIPLDDFLLVDIEVLELLTPIKFQINSLNSSIILNYASLFPPEEREKRSSKKSGSKNHEVIYPTLQNKREWVGGLNFDQDFSFEKIRSQEGITRSSIRHETSLSTELFKSELYTDYRGMGKEKESFWLSLERNDYRKRIFGDAGLSEIKVANFSSPSVDLVGGGKKLTGGYFSNRSLTRPTNFSKKNFAGALESDWEVELYHNDVLIGREVGTQEKQRYEFNNVDLYYGVNRFQFIFYGPKGERKYENKRLNITDVFSEDEQVTVTAAFGRDHFDKDNYNLSLSKNLFKSAQVDLHTVKNYNFITNETQKYYGGGVSTFLDGTLIDVNYIGNDEGRAVESSAKFNFFGINTNLSYINNTGVRSDILGQTNPIDYSWNGNFLAPLKFIQNVQMFSSIKYKKIYGVDVKYIDILNRLSFSIRNLYLSNSIMIENNVLTDEFFSRYSLGRSSFKVTTRVDKNGLRDSDFSYSFSNKKKHSYSSSLGYEYLSKKSTFKIRADKKFDSVFAGLSLETSSDKSFGIGLSFSYGLVYDQDIGTKLFNKRTSEYANIKALAFYDKNRNGVRDESEAIIQNTEFYRLAGNEKQGANEDGLAFFTFVQPLTPTDIKINLQNIDNIYLKPSSEGQTVWGRAGKTALVEFPLRVEGDIEGEVEFLDKEVTKKNIKGIIIFNGEIVKEFNVERDGYFYTQGILPGDYILRITCDTCSEKVYSNYFNMPEDGDSLFIEGVKI